MRMRGVTAATRDARDASADAKAGKKIMTAINAGTAVMPMMMIKLPLGRRSPNTRKAP